MFLTEPGQYLSDVHLGRITQPRRSRCEAFLAHDSDADDIWKRIRRGVGALTAAYAPHAADSTKLNGIAGHESGSLPGLQIATNHPHHRVR